MANAISTTEPLASLSFIGSPEDAQLITGFTEFALSDRIRDYLLNRLGVSSLLLDHFQSLAQLGSTLEQYTQGNYSTVTASAIKNTNADANPLKLLFLNDGPKLGPDLNSAKTTLNELNAAGFNIDAPVSTPVLREVFDKDGKLTFSDFLWINQDTRNSLNSIKPMSSDYPGSTKFQVSVDGSTLQLTTFDSYANLIPTQSATNAASVAIENELADSKEDLAKELARSVVAADRLDQRISQIQDNNKNQISRVNNTASERIEQLNDLLRLLRKQNVERELKKIQEEKRMSAHSSMTTELNILMRDWVLQIQAPIPVEKSSAVDDKSKASISEDILEKDYSKTNQKQVQQTPPEPSSPLKVNVNSKFS